MRIPQPGDVLADKYHLDSVLGEGGFGVVLRATTKDTNRPVAVKVLKPNAGGYEMSRAARFLREMATIAKLQSPHTLTLYDYGKTDDGVLFMVCEYVDGEDLFALMARRERLEEHEVVWILYQVLQSLAEAHDLGVLHRDVKPSNIRIFPYGKDPLRVKVLDFGLAKAIEPGKHANLTGTNKAIGTPRYMSPEQLTGKPLTPATDLYAVGIVAAEMLLGRTAPAFRDFKPGRQIHISKADDVSSALCGVVNRMLETTPRRRYARAVDVMEDLKPLRSRGPLPASRALPAVAARNETTTKKLGEPAPPRRQGPPSPATSKERTSLRLVAALLVIAVVVVAAVAELLVSMMPSEQQPRPALRANPLGVSSDRSVEETAVDASQTDVLSLGLGGVSAGCSSPAPVLIDTNVLLPADYDHAEASPAIVWLMADRGVPLRVPESAPLQRLVQEEGAILIIPEPDSKARWRPENASRVKQHVQQVLGTYCVQTNAVYVMSDGGAGTLSAELSCEPWVAAVAVNSARLPPSQMRRCGPTIWLTPRDSQVLPMSGGPNCLPPMVQTQTFPLEETEATMRSLHDCRGPEQSVPDSAGLCRTWSCDVPFVSCVVDGGIGWPGTAQSDNAAFSDRFGCDEPPPSDTDVMPMVWEFFQSVSHRTERPADATQGR